MQQPDLQFFVTTAYIITLSAVVLLIVTSLLRARRAKHTLAQLEQRDA